MIPLGIGLGIVWDSSSGIPPPPNTLRAGRGVFNLNGDPMTPAFSFGAGLGVFSLTGIAAGLATGTAPVLTAVTGSFVLTGVAANLTTAQVVTITAALGTFTLTGIAALQNISMPAAVGSFALTGIAATLSSGGSYSAEATQFFNRITDPGSTRKTIIAAFIDGLVTDALWAKADVINLYAADIAANALVNVKSSSFNTTATNSPTFTADSGYVGGGTKVLQPGFNYSTAGGNYSQNSASVFVWSLTNFGSGTDYGAAQGSQTQNTGVGIYPHYSDNHFYWWGQGVNNFSNTAVGHFYGISRVASNLSSGYVDTAGTTNSDTSAALLNDTCTFLNDTNNTRPFTGNLAFSWIGGGLTGTEEAKLYARVHTYMQAVAGAP